MECMVIFKREYELFIVVILVARQLGGQRDILIDL
jgi:hypothetical protein